MTFSVIVSCSEDFTDIDPVGSLSDASLQNATGVDLLLTGTYSVLDGIRMVDQVLTGLKVVITGGWM